MAHSFAEVPEDFPRDGNTPVVSGAQAKLLVRGGALGYHAESEAATVEAFTLCEDLAEQLSGLCSRKAEELGSRAAAVEGVYRGLLKKDWCTPAQAVWTMRRAASILGWSELKIAAVEPIHGVEMTEEQVRKLLRLDEPPPPPRTEPRSIVEKALAAKGLDWRCILGVDQPAAGANPRLGAAGI